MKQGDAGDGCRLERDTKPYSQIAALNFAHRDVRDSDPVGQLLKRPAALKPRQPDTTAEKPGGFDCQGRVCARSSHLK